MAFNHEKYMCSIFGEKRSLLKDVEAFNRDPEVEEAIRQSILAAEEELGYPCGEIGTIIAEGGRDNEIAVFLKENAKEMAEFYIENALEYRKENNISDEDFMDPDSSLENWADEEEGAPEAILDMSEELGFMYYQTGKLLSRGGTAEMLAEYIATAEDLPRYYSAIFLRKVRHPRIARPLSEIWKKWIAEN